MGLGLIGGLGTKGLGTGLDNTAYIDVKRIRYKKIRRYIENTTILIGPSEIGRLPAPQLFCGPLTDYH